MNIIAINGSPRKSWNTATLLENALEGAKSQGSKTELVHLYDLNYTGCKSCFACKLRGGKSYAKCAVSDDLEPLLYKLADADAVILGSPIYLGSVTGEMKSFLERLISPYFSYSKPFQSIFPRKINVGFVLSGNATPERFSSYTHLKSLEDSLAMIFGNVESFCSFETLQFDDYSKVVADAFDPEERARIRREQFPIDCRKAYDMGVRFAQSAM
jgi:multimeric flavodoxin WrbA